jgi:hypothetical protein
VPPHVEAAFREYLKCGILAHGFVRLSCANCHHDFMVAFSCKGRDLCPSCATVRARTVAQASEGRLRRRNSTTSELLLTLEELPDRLAQLVTPPRLHKHRTCGVLAPNARLRRAVTASAGPAGATLQLMQLRGPANVSL